MSAAIAACGAIQGDKKKLSYVTSLVLIVAVPMMIVMPWIAEVDRMHDLVAGAWLGGTLDTSASVVAAGALISDAAMKTGVIVKFSQNALIGVAAFMLVIWWALQGRRAKPATGRAPASSGSASRSSCSASSPPRCCSRSSCPPKRVNGTRSALDRVPHLVVRARLRLSIGLETRFVDLATMEGGRPALAFIGAQLVNVVWTLLLAWLLFGGVLFPLPNIS